MDANVGIVLGHTQKEKHHNGRGHYHFPWSNDIVFISDSCWGIISNQ